ncbi:hypothetical protein KP509_34G019300 [Ceratopteris richardii]|nr:hypothetical protein KP509_34G019300 [Ceratopteris richardii]
MPSNEKPGGYQQSVVSMQPQVAPPYTARPPASVLPIRSGLHWWHLIAGASCIAAAGAGTGYFFQKVLAPKLKSWLRDILLNEGKHKELKGEGQSKAPKLSPLEEAVAAAAGAANAAAAAASEVANSSREVMKLQAEEWQHLRSLMKALDNKTEDLKSTITAMSKANLENTSYHKVEGIAKPYQLSSSPAEQLQTKQGLQGYQTSNGGDRIHTNGYTTNYNNYVSQSEDEPWWHRRKVEVETYASPKQQIESSFHVSEVEAGMDQPIGANVSWTSTQSKVGMGGRQGWVPPPVPQTVNPAAASAIRYQKPATVDEAKHTSIVEGKEVLSQQSSPFLQAGLLDSSSSVMFSNPTKANEDKPRVVIEDPANTGGEGKLEIATEEKEMTAQRLYGLPNMQESPKVADFASIDKEIPIRLEHPASVNEAEARIITNGEPSNMREVGRVTEITPIEKEISSSSSKDWSSHSAEF